MLIAILGILGSLATFLVLWYQREDKRQQEKVWADFKAIEEKFRQAVALNDPTLIAQLAKQMQDMRDKYVFLKEQK